MKTLTLITAAFLTCIGGTCFAQYEYPEPDIAQTVGQLRGRAYQRMNSRMSEAHGRLATFPTITSQNRFAANQFDRQLNVRPGNAWGIYGNPVPQPLRVYIPQLEQYPGLLLNRVDRFSAGEKAGLRAGQIVLAINGVPVESVGDLPLKPGHFEITVLDNRRQIKLDLDISKTKTEHPAKWETIPETLSKTLSETTPSRNRVHVSSFADEYGQAAGEAISVSQVNGEYKIDMAVSVNGKSKKFRLTGSADEIKEQLLDIPAVAAEKIRLQLGL